jgi:SUMO ligase MMS21 Smc5/6 complex component
MPSKIKNKLQNSIIASKIDIDYNDIYYTHELISRQLSNNKLLPVIRNDDMTNYNNNITIYHMDSLYRDNSKDKYYFSEMIR